MGDGPMNEDDDWDYDDFPNFGIGVGSLHELNSDTPPGRLSGLASVAQQDVRLVGSDRKPRRRPMGFHIPRVRS